MTQYDQRIFCQWTHFLVSRKLFFIVWFWWKSMQIDFKLILYHIHRIRRFGSFWFSTWNIWLREKNKFVEYNRTWMKKILHQSLSEKVYLNKLIWIISIRNFIIERCMINAVRNANYELPCSHLSCFIQVEVSLALSHNFSTAERGIFSMRILGTVLCVLFQQNFCEWSTKSFLWKFFFLYIPHASVANSKTTQHENQVERG